MRKSALIASAALFGALGLAAPASAQFFPYGAPPAYGPAYGPGVGYVVTEPGYGYGHRYRYTYGPRGSGTDNDAAMSSPWSPNFGRGRNAGGASANYGF